MVRQNLAPRLAGALLPLVVFGYKAFKSTEIWNPNRGVVWRGMAWRNMRAHDVRVNGPPKSGPSPCGGAASFCYFWLLGL